MSRYSDILPKFWEVLTSDMRITGGFNLDRLKHYKLRQAVFAGRAEVLPPLDGFVPRKRICAYAARVKSKDPEWQEFAYFWIVDFLSGFGLLGLLVYKLVHKAPREIKFFGFTTKRAVMNVFGEHQLVAVNKFNFPNVEAWAICVGVHDRLPKSAFGTDPPDPQEGERWLFVQLYRL